MCYCIKWVHKTTGYIGQGTATFSKQVAESIANSLNNEPGAICRHWAGAVNESSRPKNDLGEIKNEQSDGD